MMNAIESGKAKLVYMLVAIADVVVMGLFYAPILVGANLRFVPGLEDFLPVVALALLCLSAMLLLFLFSRGIRVQVLKGPVSLLCVIALSIYVIIAGSGFVSVFMGGI